MKKYYFGGFRDQQQHRSEFLNDINILENDLVGILKENGAIVTDPSTIYSWRKYLCKYISGDLISKITAKSCAGKIKLSIYGGTATIPVPYSTERGALRVTLKTKLFDTDLFNKLDNCIKRFYRQHIEKLDVLMIDPEDSEFFYELKLKDTPNKRLSNQ